MSALPGFFHQRARTHTGWATISSIVLFAFLASPVLSSERVVGRTDVIPGGGGSTLVVLLHAYMHDGASLKDVQNTLQHSPALQGAHFLRPDLPVGMFSTASSSRITAELLSAIDTAWIAREKTGSGCSSRA